MTDEQLKNAPVSGPLIEYLQDRWEFGEVPPYDQMLITKRVIEALQQDGQYKVFQAPAGYRFGPARPVSKGDTYPVYWVSNDSVTIGYASNGMTEHSYATLEPIPNPCPPPVLTIEAPTVESVYGMGWEDLQRRPGFRLPFKTATEIRFGLASDLIQEGFSHFVTADTKTTIPLAYPVNETKYRICFREWKGGGK